MDINLEENLHFNLFKSSEGFLYTMKETKFCDNLQQPTETQEVFPFINISKSLESQITKINSEIKNGDRKSKQRKSKPWKFANLQFWSISNNSHYSDYNLMKAREKYKHQQISYIEGRKRFCKLFITQFEPSKHFK